MNGAPDLTQAVIGYRAWSVNSEGQLCSCGQAQFPWHEVEERAVCRREPYIGATDHTDHPASETPAKDCSCGIYAWHRPNRLARYDRTVFGAIAASGRIEVHHDGFRAERARVVCLAFGESWPWRWVTELHEIARARGIGIVALPDVDSGYGTDFAPLTEEARKHGGEVPEDMRPEAPEGAYDQAFRYGGYVSTGVSLQPSTGYVAVGTSMPYTPSGFYSPPPHHFRGHSHYNSLGNSFGNTRSRRDEITDEIRTLRHAINSARPWQSRQKRQLEEKIRDLRSEYTGLGV